MLAEIRIESLGAISSAVAEFDRGLTVLTGETGTGKTMVVTGLHLLGGARADATRVRSGAGRAVVEGRFSTAELDPPTAAQIVEILESSGADRDDDGSIIALRTVNRDGPSRAYLGGRSVPAKTLTTFTNGLLTLHGQNDQLRLMRPDEQRAALDRFAGAAPVVERYRTLRDEWLVARRDLVDRINSARERAQEADRLKFALTEIDGVDPVPGEDEALVADIRRLSELDAVREAAAGARSALSGSDADAPDSDDRCAADQLGRAVSVLAASAEGTTMVFDEVDAGVGGRAAVQIGRRLARLARSHQVIVVTHLPQVAAYADTHLVVHSSGPASEVRRLDTGERIAELARMLAGLGESVTGRAHARELLESAQADREAP